MKEIDKIFANIDNLLKREGWKDATDEKKALQLLIAQEANKARESVEYWKPYDALYDVSTLGRVRRNNRILKQSNRGNGYLTITFSVLNKQRSVYVHRLVAHTFLPNPQGKDCVNHIDGDRQNNCINNLEWCTYSENEKHAYKALNKINPNKGKHNGRPKQLTNREDGHGDSK